MDMKAMLDWRLHLLVVLASLLSEWIGIISIPLGPGTLLLLPLFYAFLIGVLFNPHLFERMGVVIPKPVSDAASPLILISVLPFIAKFGSNIGPAIDQIVAAGPALLLQELGNLGTMLVALPVAVLVLRMGRETIGATHSIAREPNIAIISDRYGLKSDEGVGIMGVYVVGTMFGTLYFALLGSYIASLDVIDIRALAMACGVGSGSMVAACSAALAEAVPASEEKILAFAGASNLLTYATGLYVSLFIALPLAERVYSLLGGPEREGSTTITEGGAGEREPNRRGQLAGATGAPANEGDAQASATPRPEDHLPKTALLLAVVCAVAWVSNTVNGASLATALPGMVILYVMALIGIVIGRFVPFYLPSVAWVSLVSILLTLPFVPGSAWIVERLSHVDFLAVVTPILAYAGLALTQREFVMFRKTGWKLVIVALLVFTGTFIGSALIADLLL